MDEKSGAKKDPKRRHHTKRNSATADTSGTSKSAPTDAAAGDNTTAATANGGASVATADHSAVEHVHPLEHVITAAADAGAPNVPAALAGSSRLAPGKHLISSS